MSVSEDTVLSKFSTLEETQESIVGVSQWVLFHRRAASKLATMWAQALAKAQGPRKLPLIYLCNEVVQQGRFKKKPEFVDAFGAVVVDAVAGACRTVTPELRNKIKRTVAVWRQRAVFDTPILDELDRALESDQAGSSGGLGSGSGLLSGSLSASSLLSGSLSGGSSLLPGSSPGPSSGLFSLGKTLTSLTSATPPALVPLVSLQKAMDTAAKDLDEKITTSISEYTDLLESEVLPAPPVYAQRLSKLQAKLVAASTPLSQSIEARTKLLAELKRQVHDHDGKLEIERQQLDNLKQKLAKTVETKEEIEQMLVGEVGEVDEYEPQLTTELDTTSPAVEPLSPEPELGQDQQLTPQDPRTALATHTHDAEPYEPVSNATPEYAPASSDDEAEPNPKKAKIQEDTPAESKTALDPAVADFLAKMINNHK